MKRVHIAVALVLLSACNPCRKAQGLLNKAVRMCPEMAQLRTDTITITLPGDSAAGTIEFAPAEVQRILRRCDSLAAASATHDTVVVAHEVVRLRAATCRVEPLNVDRPDLQLNVWWDAGRNHLQYTAHVKPRTARAPHTVPQVIHGDVRVVHATPWWLYALLAALGVLFAYLYMKMDHYRYHFNRLNRFSE